MEELKYRREDEMKDSGIEWLGKIPKEWELTLFKRTFKDTSGNGFPNRLQGNCTAEIPFYKVSDINNRDVYVYKAANYVDSKTVKNNNWNIIRKNSILLAKIGEALRKNHRKINKNKCLIDNNMLALTNTIGNLKYWYYLLNIIDMNWYVNPGAVPSINMNNLRNEYIPMCNLLEQQKIANFLDFKTSQFDSIISKKEKLIEKLEEAKRSFMSEVVTGKVKIVDREMVERKPEEMKDSGIEWLGMIPKDWEVKRLKYLASKISKGTTPSTIGKEILENGPVRFLKAENIVDNKVCLTPECFIDDNTNKILSRSELKEEDILFVIAGATIGKVAILNGELCPANTNQAISFIRLKNIENSKYAFYWLQSTILRRHMWSLAVQAAQPNLSMEDLGNFYLPYPDILERNDIVNYLEIKIKDINNIINKTKTQIQKLKEAQQSLISEAVTGKIDLRDWEIREVDEL